MILCGSPHKGEKIRVEYINSDGDHRYYETRFSGVIPNLQRRYQETSSEYIRSKLEEFMSVRPCPVCGASGSSPRRSPSPSPARTSTRSRRHPWTSRCAGSAGCKAKRTSAAAAHGQRRRSDCRYSANGAGQLTSAISGPSPLGPRQRTISHQVLKEIAARLGFMVNVGLDYLTLDRTAVTLSGGEAQRIRLATQIGSQLMGVLYILDEPIIGLHQRDNARLIETLKGMRDLGNTVLVVEHDEDTIRAADWVVDMGPGAGEHGGYVVCSGPARRRLSTRPTA